MKTLILNRAIARWWAWAHGRPPAGTRATRLLLLVLLASLLYHKGTCQSITLHSIADARQTGGDNGYTMDGSRMMLFSRPKLLSPGNFGPSGIYPKNVFIIDGYQTSGSLTQISAVPTTDMFFFGTFDRQEASLQTFTTAEIDSLYNWSKRGGKLIIAASAVLPNPGVGLFDTRILNSKWGFDIILDVTSMIVPTPTGIGTSIFNGPFGGVSYAYQGGSSQGFFFTTPPNSVVLANTVAGDPTLIVDCNTLDLIVSDVDPYTILGGITQGPDINNVQDAFWANTIAFMDQMEGPPVITRNGYTLSTGTYSAYQWYWNGAPINGATGQSLDVDTNGIYSVKVTLSCTCEVMSDPEDIKDYQSVYHVSAMHTNAECGHCDGTASATASQGTGPYSYLWSTGDTTQSIGPVCTGVYTVTATDMHQNTATTTATISDNTLAPPSIQAANLLICAGDSAWLCTNGNYAGYAWNNSDTSACMYVKDAGSYYLTVTDNNGCTAESNHLLLSVNPVPPVSISVIGDSLTAYGGTTYQWYLNGVVIAGAVLPAFNINQPGSYAVAVTDSNGCTALSNPVAYTGIPNSEKAGFFNFYPNPVTQNLTVDLQESNYDLTVCDVTGRKVFGGRSASAKTEIDFSRFASGVYFITAQTNRSTITRKVVKQ
jgi:hypothetical protein